MKEVTKLDLGSIKIHKKVLAEIAQAALQDVEGVKFVSKKFSDSITELFGHKTFPGISIIVEKNNQVSIEIKIRVQYGRNIHNVAREVQNAVRSAIEKTADVDLKDININIQGIERGGT